MTKGKIQIIIDVKLEVEEVGGCMETHFELIKRITFFLIQKKRFFFGKNKEQ